MRESLSLSLCHRITVSQERESCVSERMMRLVGGERMLLTEGRVVLESL